MQICQVSLFVSCLCCHLSGGNKQTPHAPISHEGTLYRTWSGTRVANLSFWWGGGGASALP